MPSPKILITGYQGFIGKSLCLALREAGRFNLFFWGRGDALEQLFELIEQVDIVIHLTGVNRPSDLADFQRINVDLTRTLCQKLQDKFEKTGRAIPIVLSSSQQSGNSAPYGGSKIQAEAIILAYAEKTGAKVQIYRLPGVFGKWAKPYYNSVVATFCYQISRGLPIEIHDPERILSLAYIDDVVRCFLDSIGSCLQSERFSSNYADVLPIYHITLANLANTLQDFSRIKEHLTVDGVGKDLKRALYATYVSYLPKDNFSYPLKKYADARGEFVEMLKFGGSGQVSYFTAHPGVVRGEHYHHTKTEKFLVVRGRARFNFRSMENNEQFSFDVEGGVPQIVESIPGWAHNVVNIGENELIVMLWANEVFDRNYPDTISHKV